MIIQDINMISGDTNNITYRVANDLTNATINWVVFQNYSLPAEISKSNSTGGGIVITDAINGKFQVTLNSSETKGMSGVHYYEGKITDSSGNVITFVEGNLIISPSFL